VPKNASSKAIVREIKLPSAHQLIEISYIGALQRHEKFFEGEQVKGVIAKLQDRQNSLC
jgi:hypothetical protein